MKKRLFANTTTLGLILHYFLATCCIVSLLLTLCACGSQVESPQPTPNPPASSQTEPTDTETSDSSSLPAEPEPSVDTEVTPEGDPNSGQDAATAPATDQSGENLPAEPEPEVTQPAPAKPASKKIEGLIFLTTISRDEFEVFSFDPVSGVKTEISRFNCDSYNEEYIYILSDEPMLTLDQTCTRRAITYHLGKTDDDHAAWITSDGELFDVTEKVGMGRQGEFSQKVKHYAVGFTKDGYFIFKVRDPDNKNADPKFYYVPVDDVRPETLKEGSPDGVEFVKHYSNVVGPFVPLSDGRLLAENNNSCLLYANAQDFLDRKDYTEFIPESDRKNWRPIVSPDEQQVAFLSKPQRGSDPTDVFIVPISGGNPERIPSHDFVIDDSHMLEFGKTILVDWR